MSDFPNFLFNLCWLFARWLYLSQTNWFPLKRFDSNLDRNLELSWQPEPKSEMNATKSCSTLLVSFLLHCNHPMNLSHLMSHAGLQRLSSKNRPPTKLSFCWRLLNLFSSCHECIRLKKWARRKMRSLKFEWRSLFLPFSIVMLPVPIRGLKSITRHLKKVFI